MSSMEAFQLSPRPNDNKTKKPALSSHYGKGGQDYRLVNLRVPCPGTEPPEIR